MKTGKWYFEFEAVTGGDMRVGWARPGCKPDVELGTDELAFVFDGYRVSFIQFNLTHILIALHCTALHRGQNLLRTPGGCGVGEINVFLILSDLLALSPSLKVFRFLL